MGYYTDFNLTNDSFIDGEGIAEALSEISGYPWTSRLEMYGVKWRNHEKDMRALSKKFPDVLFTLEGEGEESGDIWKQYHKNGLCQHAKAEIVFSPFDAAELK